MNPVHERMAAIVKGCVEELGFYCLEAKAHPQKRQIMIEAVVDTPAGVTLDQCAAASRAIAKAIDDEFPDDAYELHVGSPGIDRPLEFDWQFARHTGRTVRMFVDDEGHRTSVEMKLLGLEGGTIRCAKRDGKEVVFDRSAVTQIVVVPEFEHK